MKRKRIPRYLQCEQTEIKLSQEPSSTLSEPAIQYLQPQELLSRTLSELLNKKWKGEIPIPTDSYPIRHLYALYDRKISEYTIEDFRFLVNQNIALEYIMPLTLEILSKNILAAGDFYDGDLLNAALTVPSSFWKENPSQHSAMKELLETQQDDLNSAIGHTSLDKTISIFLHNTLQKQ